MAGIATILSAASGLISGVASIAGGAAQARGIRAQAAAQQANLNYQAKQTEIKAKEEQAAAFLEAEEYRRRKELTLSNLQAAAAGSGFTATDPTTLQIGSRIEKRGTLQQGIAQYGGASRRFGLEARAEGLRAEGRAGVIGAGYRARGSILAGFANAASGFGRFASGIGGAFSGGSGSGLRYG